MVKNCYFATTLLFASIHIFLLATIVMSTNRKRSIQSIQRQRKSIDYKRNRYKITSPVQGINEVENIHQDETDTVPVQGPVQHINAVE